MELKLTFKVAGKKKTYSTIIEVEESLMNEILIPKVCFKIAEATEEVEKETEYGIYLVGIEDQDNL
jgi:hypothetical protein